MTDDEIKFKIIADSLSDIAAKFESISTLLLFVNAALWALVAAVVLK